MRFLLGCLLLAGCEKAGGVETTGGTSTHEGSASAPRPPNVIATIPGDAGVVVDAAADAAAVAAAADAAPRRPSRNDDSLKKLEAEAAGFADLLTVDGRTADMGDMAKRRPGGDLGAQIADVRRGNKSVVIGGGAGRNPSSTSVGTARGPSDLGGLGSGQPPGPRGRVSVTNKQAFDDSTLTPDVVLAKIQSAYMAGLKRCYKVYLDKDPTARGKLTLSLTVNEGGRVVSAKANGFASQIDDCITAQMSSWRFPVPKDKDGEATEATFSIGLTLVPD